MCYDPLSISLCQRPLFHYISCVSGLVCGCHALLSLLSTAGNQQNAASRQQAAGSQQAASSQPAASNRKPAASVLRSSEHQPAQATLDSSYCVCFWACLWPPCAVVSIMQPVASSQAASSHPAASSRMHIYIYIYMYIYIHIHMYRVRTKLRPCADHA